MLKLIVALVKIVVIGLKTMQMENGEYLLHAYFLLSLIILISFLFAYLNSLLECRKVRLITFIYILYVRARMCLKASTGN